MRADSSKLVKAGYQMVSYGSLSHSLEGGGIKTDAYNSWEVARSNRNILEIRREI